MSYTVLINVKGYDIYNYDCNEKTTLEDILEYINDEIKIQIPFTKKDFVREYEDADITIEDEIFIIPDSNLPIIEELKEKGLWNEESFIKCDIIENIKIYLLKFDIESKNDDGDTPLLNASWEGNLEVVEFLVEKGANIESVDEEYNTPLNAASIQGRLETVKFLIENGADIQSKDMYGNTPFINASSWGNLEVVIFLLEKGINIESKDKDGNTPLNAASIQGNLEVVIFLIENGADTQTKDKDGNTPLDNALKRRYLKVIEYLNNL